MIVLNRCPLHLCVESQSEAALEILLGTDKLDLEAKTREGHTALWLALRNPNPQDFSSLKINIPQLLVKAGASPNAVSSRSP